MIRDERGASAVEYGLMVAGVAAALIFIIFALGKTLGSEFKSQNDNNLGCAGCSTTTSSVAN